MSEPSDEPLKQVKANFKTITEIERILTECIRIAKDNSHMINETCSHIINRNMKRGKEDFDLVQIMEIGYPIYIELLSDFIDNIIITDQKKTEKLVIFLTICKELESTNKKIEQLNNELKMLILPTVNRFLDL